jgi:NADH dehydrogenase
VQSEVHVTTHNLSATQFIARPIDEVFGFFADPHNLARLTPSSMDFAFLSHDFEMRQGLQIDYRLRPLFGIPARWRTLITEFDAPRRFADVQLSGPYHRWQHRHTFAPAPGGTTVHDDVEYELPFGPLGALGQRWLVRAELERIFRYRARAIEDIFAVPAQISAPRTVAVAGGTGFVGGAIARELYKRGHRVIVLSRRGEIARGSLPEAVEIRSTDVTVDAGLTAALHGADTLVISLAFRNLPIEAPRRGQTFAAVDGDGTARLVRAALGAGVERIVYLSGAGAAIDAPRHWFRVKWRAEQSVRSSGLGYTLIRPTWVYGPGDVSLNRFINLGRRLPIVPMTNLGNQLLAPVFVDDVARLAADAVVDPAADRQVFEIGGPQTMPMREVIGRALKAAGLSRPIIPGSASLIKLAVAPLGLLPEPPMTPSAIDFINQPAAVDVGPLLERMPRRLTPLGEGLATYLGPSAGPGDLRFDGAAPESSTLAGRPIGVSSASTR